jgi:menaquinone-dependent protoporphyrinogen oxidase
MPGVLLLYATVEGQTARIAERLANRLRGRGIDVDLLDVDVRPADLDIASYAGVLVGASIHYGDYPRSLRKLTRASLPALQSRPAAFFSVCLSAGGPGARPATAQAYLEKFQRRTGWRPRLATSFAGALQYSRYGPIKRAVMRMIVGMAGGDTDMSRDYEYTDWAAVDRFADEFSGVLGK